MVIRYALNTTGAPIYTQTQDKPALWWEYDTEEQRGKWVRGDGTEYGRSHIQPHFYCVRTWVVTDVDLQMDVGL